MDLWEEKKIVLFLEDSVNSSILNPSHLALKATHAECFTNYSIRRAETPRVITLGIAHD